MLNLAEAQGNEDGEVATGFIKIAVSGDPDRNGFGGGEG